VQYHEISPYVGEASSAPPRETSRVEPRLGIIHTDPSASVPHQGTPHLDYRPDLRYARRRVKLYRKDALGVDSLGRPAEVLVLTTPQREPQHVIHVGKPDERAKEDSPGSADAMMGKLKAEKGIPSERGVAENLEELRDAWISQRKRKGRPLNPAEQDDLVNRLDAGFTMKQLVGYYMQAGSRTAVRPADLDIPYSTGTYTRSAWHAGTTPFPGDASARLKACRSTLDDFEHTEEGVDGDVARLWIPTVKPHTPKRTVIERLIWECWHLKSVRDEEASGELDIWIRPEHNKLLLNHSR